MAKDMISNESIDRVLKKSGQSSSSYSSNTELDYSIEDSIGGDTKENSGAYLVSAAGLFIAVSIGTYFFVGSGFSFNDFMPGQSKEYTSIVDFSCKGLWIKNGKNDLALNCYLTQNIRRLCEPREKQHLAAMVKQYRMHRDSYETKIMVGGMKSALTMRNSMGDIAESGKALFKSFGQSQNGGSGGTFDAEAFKKHTDIVIKIQKSAGLGHMEAAMDMKHLSDDTLVYSIRKLGKAGYMSKGDFGWFADELVGEAFADLTPEAAVCNAGD
jgi:hypothetical protein